MTPEERAEKIKSLTRNCAVSDDNELTALIAAEIRHAEYAAGEAAAMILKITRDAEIRAAVEEAGQECSKCQRAHAKYCAECFDGEKRAAVKEAVKSDSTMSLFIHKRLLREAVEEAFECARNDADRREHIEWLKAQAKAEAFAEGKREAYLDAAKIAEEDGCHEYCCSDPAFNLPKLLRARAAEVGK